MFFSTTCSLVVLLTCGLFYYLCELKTSCMRKLVFTLLVILSFCNSVLAQSTIEPRLQEVLSQKGDEMISVNIILKSQMNFNNLRSRSEGIIDKDARRNALVDELKNFTEKEQKGKVKQAIHSYYLDSAAGPVQELSQTDVATSWLCDLEQGN